MRMGERIRHRGPDGSRYWLAEGVGLTHQRLAIIDVSPTGNQPMHDSTGRFTIVFNGEIYNYQELRDSLKVDWKSTSDTEVILEGYRVWGEDVVKKLRGMFALAIWDQQERRLFLARDRIGKKPLFYTITQSGDFAFASEIKALAVVRALEPDPTSLRLFLGLQYVPTPRTGFYGVQQLEAGHMAVLEKGEVTKRRYHEWSREIIKRTDAEVDDGIRTVLDEAVKMRMLAADVPVGAFLSGGVDSAAVVAMATKYSRGPFHTFTMGFSNARMDERLPARALARHFKTEHHDFEARPQDLIDIADELIGHYDAPYADSSALPLWLLARKTSKYIKVVLTGDGGDELFGGYRRYVAYQRAKFFSATALRSAISSASLQLASFITRDTRFSRLRDTTRAFRNLQSFGWAYGEMFTGAYFNTVMLRRLLKETAFFERNRMLPSRYIQERMGGDDSLEAAMFFDLTSYLPDDLNVKMDRATMRFGLEARAPFLDQELVQFALSLPIEQKILGGKTKVALKRALQRIVPPEVLRRPKQGFQVPLAEWFRGPLKAVLYERCVGTQSPLTEMLDSHFIESLIVDNERGADHGNRLWMLFSLSTWLEKMKNPAE